MKRSLAALLTLLLPMAASANCISPWVTHFACEIEGKNSRAEFCRLRDTKQYPDKKEGYYTYADASGKTKLYFETDSIWFSTKDTNVDHPRDLAMAMGYKLKNYIYSFTVITDKDNTNIIRDAEVRVYKSTDDFTDTSHGKELNRLYCKPSSIIAEPDLIAP